MVNTKRMTGRCCCRKGARSLSSSNGIIVRMSGLQYAFYKLLEYLVIFFIGGAVYYLFEIIGRGHSHWSMFILGGICLIVVGLLNEKPFFPENFGIIPQALMGTVAITVLEFITGLIVNVWWGLGVWDYSNMPLNIMGQICLPFTLLWVVLSVLAIVVDDYIRYYLFGEEKPHYVLWME